MTMCKGCDAYSFPHRLGSGACEECGCPDAPACPHWLPDKDPYGTGDTGFSLYEPMWATEKPAVPRSGWGMGGSGSPYGESLLVGFPVDI